MADGSLRRFFAPIGLILLIIGVAEAACVFVFILLAIEGEFSERIARMSGATALAFILGGAALNWLGR